MRTPPNDSWGPASLSHCLFAHRKLLAHTHPTTTPHLRVIPADCFPISCLCSTSLFDCNNMAVLNAIQLTFVYDRTQKEPDSFANKVRHAALKYIARSEGVHACYVSKQAVNQEYWIFLGKSGSGLPKSVLTYFQFTKMPKVMKTSLNRL